MTVKVHREGSLQAEIKKLYADSKKVVNVGVFNGGSYWESGKSVVEVATYLEYGWVQQVTPKQRGFFLANYGIPLHVGQALYLPPRPFIRDTFASKWKEWETLGINYLRKTLDVQKTLAVIGLKASEDMKQSITDGGTALGKFAPRSSFTLMMYAIQAERGKHKVSGKNNTTTTNPLVRSGFLLQNIKFEIKDGE